jgi:hypothetical protein
MHQYLSGLWSNIFLYANSDFGWCYVARLMEWTSSLHETKTCPGPSLHAPDPNKVHCKTIDQVLVKMNWIPIQKLIPLVYRFETYCSCILFIGSFNTANWMNKCSSQGTVSCDPIVWSSCGDVHENENAIEEPRAQKHRHADHCNLNVHDDRRVYRFEIYFMS